jgi:hypothetical protein
MDEQGYKNLIAVYQNRLFDSINQIIALEAKELKYRQTIESLNQKNQELEKSLEKPKRSSKTTEDFT